jgi:hypothetical protein
MKEQGTEKNEASIEGGSIALQLQDSRNKSKHI